MAAPSVRPVSVQTLAHLIFKPLDALPGFPPPQRIGTLSVWEMSGEGRQQTILACHHEFTLLVDQFKFPEPRQVELVVDATSHLQGSRLRYRCSVSGLAEVALHMLGDYAVERAGDTLVLQQRLAQGRFLLALTSDLEARVRTLNGWAIEVRTRGQVHQLLHSNRSGRARPLGPIHSDARYALADWPQTAEMGLTTLSLRLQVLRATEVQGSLQDVKPAAQPDWVI